MRRHGQRCLRDLLHRRLHGESGMPPTMRPRPVSLQRPRDLYLPVRVQRSVPAAASDRLRWWSRLWVRQRDDVPGSLRRVRGRHGRDASRSVPASRFLGSRPGTPFRVGPSRNPERGPANARHPRRPPGAGLTAPRSAAGASPSTRRPPPRGRGCGRDTRARRPRGAPGRRRWRSSPDRARAE
jgi:hypothetical protein